LRHSRAVRAPTAKPSRAGVDGGRQDVSSPAAKRSRALPAADRPGTVTTAGPGATARRHAEAAPAGGAGRWPRRRATDREGSPPTRRHRSVTDVTAAGGQRGVAALPPCSSMRSAATCGERLAGGGLARAAKAAALGHAHIEAQVGGRVETAPVSGAVPLLQRR